MSPLSRTLIPNLIAVMLLLNCQGKGFAQMAPRLSEIEASNDILLKTSIEILKTNTELLKPESEQSKFSKLRIALYNAGASMAIQAGLISVAAARWSTLNHPETASENAIKTGPIMLIIGNSVIVAGLLTERIIEKLEHLRASYKGKVANLQSLYKAYRQEEANRDKLLSQLESLSPDERNSISDYTEFLKQLNQLCIADTVQILKEKNYYAKAKIATLVGESIAASTAGYCGGLMALVATSKEKPILAGPAGIGFVVSGATLAVTPLLSHLYGRIGSKQKTAWLDTTGQSGKFQLLSITDTKRKALLEEVSNLVEQTHTNLASTNRLNVKDTVRKTISTGMVGCTELAGGTQLTSASYLFDIRRKNADIMFSTLVATADTTYIPGVSVWLANSFLTRKRPDLQVFTFGKQNDYLRSVYLARKQKFERLSIDSQRSF